MEKPAWLPELVSVDGEWDEILPKLYRIFSNDFIKIKTMLEQRPVWWDRRVLDDGGMPEGFWHLISKLEEKTGKRLFDPRRAERIPWCSPTINHCNDLQIKMWDYLEFSGRRRTYLWLETWDYVIILEKRKHQMGEIAFLITAYFVDGKHSRNRLKEKFHNKIG